MTALAPRTRWGLAFAALGAVAFSGKAIIVKLGYAHSVDALTLLMLRMMLAFPAFVLMAWWGGRGRKPLRRADILGIIGLGFSGYYLSSWLDFQGLADISASLERLILYLNPTFVLMLGMLLHRQKVQRHQWVAMAISYSGLLLVFGHELHVTGEHALRGSALVLGSAITYATYLTFSGQMVRRLGAMRLAGWASGVASLLVLVHYALATTMPINQIPAEVWRLSMLNAALCTVLPVLLVMMAIERVGAGLTSQLGMVGPLATLWMGALILHEPFNLWIVGGTALVLLGVYRVSSARPRPVAEA